MNNQRDRARLNIEIPEELRRLAKAEAARTGKTLKEILEALIQKWLNGEIKLEQPK